MNKRFLFVLVSALIFSMLALGVLELRAQDARSILWPVLVKYTETMNNRDLKGHLNCFASQVTWFGKSMTRAQLEKELAPQFKRYETMSMTLMEPFEFRLTGNTARVTCRKLWYFCDRDKGTGFCGNVDAAYGLVKEQGQWKINSVQDLDVIWSDKNSKECCQ
jgi:hypothetical protein